MPAGVKFTDPEPEPDPVPEPDPEPDPEPETIHIHILEDGLTAHGRVWYRGQELEYTVGSGLYKATQDRNGRSWLDLDDRAQMQRFGRVMFRHGPWPGADYEDERAREAERRRARTPPSMPPPSG